jgi:hypothetical protein
MLAEMVEVAGSLPEDRREAVEETDILPLRSVITICRREWDLTNSILHAAAERN